MSSRARARAPVFLPPLPLPPSPCTRLDSDAAAAAAAGAGGGYIAEDDEIPPEVAAIVGPRPAFRLLLPTPQLNALIEEALEAVAMQRGGELHMPE